MLTSSLVRFCGIHLRTISQLYMISKFLFSIMSLILMHLNLLPLLWVQLILLVTILNTLSDITIEMYAHNDLRYTAFIITFWVTLYWCLTHLLKHSALLNVFKCCLEVLLKRHSFNTCFGLYVCLYEADVVVLRIIFIIFIKVPKILNCNLCPTLKVQQSHCSALYTWWHHQMETFSV